MLDTPRYLRDRQRHRFFQAMFALAAAMILALSVSTLMSARSQAAIDCTSRSIATSSTQCDVSSSSR